MLRDKKIILGVTGGIAAYKAADLASKLSKSGAKVFTVMTENATKLIAPRTFQALTLNPVVLTMWNSPEEYKITHIELTADADAVVVAPATANIIGKYANGLCDDLLSTSLCACWSKPTVFAPAMNNNMWNNPAVQKNIETIRQMGVRLVGPNTGHLACGTEDIGRMAEPVEIIEALKQMLSNKQA